VEITSFGTLCVYESSVLICLPESRKKIWAFEIISLKNYHINFLMIGQDRLGITNLLVLVELLRRSVAKVIMMLSKNI
jgi:hypothetical protein